MKRIAEYMTAQPWTVQLDDSLALARRMMAEREIHHLPVVDGGAVVGMVTERDLALAADRLGTVADVMVSVHRVARETPVEDVLDAMTTQRWDAVVVTGDGTVEGIFTAMDAVRVLREVVRHRRRA
jgi:acetoin utilization protein AcuB